MKRVVSIAGVVLDNKCFISSEFDVDNYLGSKTTAVDGSTILFVQAKGALTKTVQITSKTSGWVSKDVKDALIATVGIDSIVVGFDDSTNGTYYYDNTTTPIKFTEIYEGSLWYNVEINLLKG